MPSPAALRLTAYAVAVLPLLAAATLQEAVQQLEPDTQQQGTGDAAVSSHGGAGPLHPGPQVAAGAEALSSGAVKQRAATAMACMGVVARLQALPMPDGCDAYLQRCLVLEEAMSG